VWITRSAIILYLALPGSFNVWLCDAATPVRDGLFLGTGLSLWQNWNLLPMAIYSFFAGIDASLSACACIQIMDTQIGPGDAPAAVGLSF